MNPREQTLASVLVGLLVLGGGAALGYFFLYKPYVEARSAEAALETEMDKLKKEADEMVKNAKRLAAARTRTFPADEALSGREYTVALDRMIAAAGIKDHSINKKPVDNGARAVPQIAKDKPAYTRVAYELIFKKTDMWALKDFLKAYYEFGLMHQITALTIKKEDEPGAKVQRRNDLTVTITTESLIIDGAENRATLLPVPTALAALGGGVLHKAVGTVPDLARNLRAPAERGSAVSVPTAFAALGGGAGHSAIALGRERDLSLMVLRDPFSGPLPPPPAFKIAKIDDVKLKPDEKPRPVKVALSGDGATGAKVTAKVSGKLFPEAPLKVDTKTNAIELPALPPMTEDLAKLTSTVSVSATNTEGKTETMSFKVSVADLPKEEVEQPPPKPTEDISGVILLVGVVQGSDGTAWARVSDNANRTRYDVTVKGGKLEVKKEWFGGTRGWRLDVDHEAPPSAMHISDTFSTTNRMLKVIGVEGNSLIVADLQPKGPPKPAAKPPADKGKGGFVRPGSAPKQGPGDPLAVYGGNLAVAVPLPQTPKYYRWVVGQPLSGLKPLSDSEKADALRRAATGPVLAGP
jgi:hypothetical protein